METAKIQIILAEDDADDRMFFELALKAAKISSILKALEDGAYLMEYIKQNPVPLPDVIFLDINMPRKDGIECLRELRELREFDRIPVLMFSTSVADHHVTDAKALGANRFVRKPSSIEAQTRMMQQIFCEGWKAKLQDIPAHEFLVVA